MTVASPDLLVAERPRRRFKVPIGPLLAGIVVLALVIAALFPGLIAPFDPSATDTSSSLLPPSLHHLFGTDLLGRDVFSRVVHGTRYSLGLGLSATLLAVGFAIVLGLLSGLAPRWVDEVVMRFLEILLAFPEILLALIVIALLGSGTTNVLIAITVAAIPIYARMVRVTTLQVRTSGYVEAATALGQRRSVVVLRHILPNVLGPLMVLATIGIGNAIIAGSALSFLGLGPVPPTPEWGLMLADSRDLLGRAWWAGVFPGLMITVTVISTVVLGRFIQGRIDGSGR